MKDEKYVDKNMISDKNFVYILSAESITELGRELIDSAGIKVSKKQLVFNAEKYEGEFFAIIRCVNPFEPYKYMLLVIVNGKEVEQELISFMRSFDSSSLFYSSNIIFSDNKYHYKNLD